VGQFEVRLRLSGAPGLAVFQTWVLAGWHPGLEHRETWGTRINFARNHKLTHYRSLRSLTRLARLLVRWRFYASYAGVAVFGRNSKGCAC